MRTVVGTMVFRWSKWWGPTNPLEVHLVVEDGGTKGSPHTRSLYLNGKRNKKVQTLYGGAVVREWIPEEWL